MIGNLIRTSKGKASKGKTEAREKARIQANLFCVDEFCVDEQNFARREGIEPPTDGFGIRNSTN